ncbi:MAG TPA: hypothetical protein VL092_13325 [Chitinophagaceae bacterium]|nr:hypothetical protein [Chitinophagaceae bacterium]
MTPAGTGRLCNACDKVVTDFTAMSDAELINFFARHAAGEHPCGHFKADQLNKTITVSRPSKKFKSFKLAASFLLAQVLFYQGKAFGKINPQIEVVSYSDTPADGSIKITGHVLDYHSNKPIGGLKVYIDNTEHYAITDKNGRFSIVVPETMNGAITLLTEYVNNKNYVAGSIILAKKGDVEELSRSELILYRYPEEPLDELQIIEYKVPLISGGYMRGTPAQVTPVKKETFWKRITKVFRKK